MTQQQVNQLASEVVALRVAVTELLQAFRDHAAGLGIKSKEATGPEELLNLNQVAAWAGLSGRTIRNEVGRGKLRAVRCGTRILRFRKIDLEDWLFARTTKFPLYRKQRQTVGW